MIEILFAAALIAGQQDTPAAELRTPRHWTTLSWSRYPRPDYPRGERGVLQANITCTAAEGLRLTACRIDRLAPERTRFGAEVLQSLRAARFKDGRMQSGDTVTFSMWACSDVSQPCRRAPWPDDQPVALDPPATAPQDAPR